MLLAKIEETIRPLSRVEKLRIIQFITMELLKDERLAYFEPEQTHVIYSAYDEHQAAHQLATLLKQKSS